METGEGADLLLALMRGLEGSWFGAEVRRSTWLYPLASVLHIVGVALLLGSIALFDLRALGLARALPLRAVMAAVLPVARVGFAVQATTGFVMFASDASHLYDNPFFVAKMALIVAALANVALFHARLRADPLVAAEGEAPPWARLGAALSLAGWTAVAVCGRMIAYV